MNLLKFALFRDIMLGKCKNSVIKKWVYLEKIEKIGLLAF